jgi:glycosyltransferase involved in cell wall biosynthesis
MSKSAPNVYIASPNSLNLRSANAIQTHTTLRELRKRDPELIALVPRRDRTPSRFHEVGAIHLLCFPIGKFSRFYRSTLWYYAERSLFAWLCALYLLLRGWKGGTIYVRDVICAGWWTTLFGPLFKARVIYEAHDLESRNPSRAKEPWAQGPLHLLDRLALTRASTVVSLTEDFRHYLAQVGWRDPSEVAIVPDAYDQTLFGPQDRATSRKAINCDPDAQLIVYAGMTFAYRWLDGLLDVAAELMRDNPRLRLALVGGRPAEIAQLREQAERLGIAERIELPGQLPQADVLHYLGAADLLVIPDTVSDVTASPLKLFEYLALGQPLVLPDLPALREIISPQIAHYFGRRNLAELRQAIENGLADHSEAAQAERRSVASEHTYALRSERILTLLNQNKQKTS